MYPIAREMGGGGIDGFIRFPNDIYAKVSSESEPASPVSLSALINVTLLTHLIFILDTVFDGM